MTNYTLPLLGLLILAPLPAGAAPDPGAPDTPGKTADRAAGAEQGGAPAAKSEAKPKSREEAPAAAKSEAKPESKEETPAATKGKPKDGAAKPAATKVELPAPPPQPVVDPVAAAAATAAATGYLTALKEKGFAAAPAWLHPAALARFKDLVMPRLKDEQARGTRTLLNATFGRDAGYPVAAAADPTAFLTRFARLISAREPDAAPRFSALTPIGVLREGEQLHVLLRLTQGSGPEAAERIEVVSLLPQDKEWKVLLDGRLQTLASALGSPIRGDGPRGTQPRLEPFPEGLPPAPIEPQGPAGVQAVPPVPPALPAPRTPR